MRPIDDIARVIAHWETHQPGQPRITWYDSFGRIELSGKVLGQWVSKTANFLTDEGFDGPDLHLATNLPCHWRRTVLALSTWVLGGHFTQVSPDLTAPPTTATVWATHLAPSLSPGTTIDVPAQRLAVPLAPLARDFGSDLEWDVIDYALNVPNAADHLQQSAPTNAEDAQLLERQAANLTPWHGRRVLIDTTHPWSEVALAALLVNDGSWVGAASPSADITTLSCSEGAVVLPWSDDFGA